MYKKLMWLLWVFASAVQANAPDFEAQSIPSLRPSQQQALAAHLTARIIGEHHYKPVALDDSLSEKIFDSYLKARKAAATMTRQYIRDAREGRL